MQKQGNKMKILITYIFSCILSELYASDIIQE